MSNKVSGKRQKGADSPELREKDARSMAGIMGVFAVAVLGIFPLAYDNYYYNILETKYHFYCVASIAAHGADALLRDLQRPDRGIFQRGRQ